MINFMNYLLNILLFQCLGLKTSNLLVLYLLAISSCTFAIEDFSLSGHQEQPIFNLTFQDFEHFEGCSAFENFMHFIISLISSEIEHCFSLPLDWVNFDL